MPIWFLKCLILWKCIGSYKKNPCAFPIHASPEPNNYIFWNGNWWFPIVARKSPWYRKMIVTRMHSSRMHTGRSLTVWRGEGASFPACTASFPGGRCFLPSMHCFLPERGASFPACIASFPEGVLPSQHVLLHSQHALRQTPPREQNHRHE